MSYLPIRQPAPAAPDGVIWAIVLAAVFAGALALLVIAVLGPARSAACACEARP